MLPTEDFYNRLRDLALTARASWHEAEAAPGRADIILDELTAEINRTALAVAIQLKELEGQAAARTNSAKRALHAAERRITTALTNIAAAGIGDDFDPRGFFVYCLWGKDCERPLYVGLSRNVLARLGAHLGNAARRPHIRRVTLIRCKTRRHMEQTELRLITEHQPPWNVVGIVDKDRSASAQLSRSQTSAPYMTHVGDAESPIQADGALTCDSSVGDTGFEPVTSSVSGKRGRSTDVLLGG